MRLDQLERELRAERPEVDGDFASRLDQWAARGFPRGGELDPRRPRLTIPLPRPLPRAGELLRETRPRRLLAPAGAVVTLLVVVGVAVTQIDPADPGSDATLIAPAEVETQGEPDAATEPRDLRPEAEMPRGRGDRSLGEAPMAQDEGRLDDVRPGQRRVAQTIALALATSPGDFRDSADGVLDVLRDHHGFVVRSSVSGGDPNVGGAELGRASFRLRVPAAQLQAALGALSDLGHVVSRTDGTRDITARFQSAQERIEALTASRDRLLRQLEEAVTETEQESVRRRLRIVERRLTNARGDLASAQQRVRLVPVNATIIADPKIDDGGSWDIGDALDDAGRVLTVAAGVILVSAAVLLPLAIVVAIVWLLASRARRFQRDRALDS